MESNFFLQKKKKLLEKEDDINIRRATFCINLDLILENQTLSKLNFVVLPALDNLNQAYSLDETEAIKRTNKSLSEALSAFGSGQKPARVSGSELVKSLAPIFTKEALINIIACVVLKPGELKANYETLQVKSVLLVCRSNLQKFRKIRFFETKIKSKKQKIF